MAWSGYLLGDLLICCGLEFGGAEIVQGAVQAGAVVPADVLHDGAPGAGSGGPWLQIEQLAFDRGEERFREGVVPALAFAARRQGDLAVAGQPGEGSGGVLAGYWAGSRGRRNTGPCWHECKALEVLWYLGGMLPWRDDVSPA